MKLLLKQGPPHREIQSASLPAGGCMCFWCFFTVVKAVFSVVEFKSIHVFEDKFEVRVVG